MSQRSDSELGSCLLEFNREAVLYCQGISNSAEQEYAMDYARMLQNRAKGLVTVLPRIPVGLFEPNRNLIRSVLDQIGQRHFLRQIQNEVEQSEGNPKSDQG